MSLFTLSSYVLVPGSGDDGGNMDDYDDVASGSGDAG